MRMAMKLRSQRECGRRARGGRQCTLPATTGAPLQRRSQHFHRGLSKPNLAGKCTCLPYRVVGTFVLLMLVGLQFVGWFVRCIVGESMMLPAGCRPKIDSESMLLPGQTDFSVAFPAPKGRVRLSTIQTGLRRSIATLSSFPDGVSIVKNLSFRNLTGYGPWYGASNGLRTRSSRTQTYSQSFKADDT